MQESRAQRESQDALELFATEAESAPRIERWSNAVRPRAAWAVAFIQRNPMVGIVIVAAACLVTALWAINRFVGSDAPAVQTAAAPVAATDETSAATSDAATVTTPVNRSPRPASPNANAGRTSSSTIARAEQPVRNRESAPAGIARPTPTTPQSGVIDSPAPVAPAIAPAAAPPPTEAAAAVVDNTIYSEQDTDVVPPQTSEDLPGPTFSRWTTRTNAMEVIVSQTGAVERVRLVTPPQRMPDILVLSRAKVWKFTPATKDGKPVRYRLLLRWEVNP